MHHVDLLEEELIADGGEGGEQVGTAEMDVDVVVPLVEATKQVQDQGAVTDDLTKINEIIGHHLELLTVVVDREINLSEGVEIGIKVESVSLLVAEEVLLDGDPRAACVGVVGDDRLSKVMGDRAIEPRLDDDVQANLIEVLRNVVAVEVILQRVIGDGEEELLTPA